MAEVAGPVLVRDAVISEDAIRDVTEAIVREVDPERVILFGSRARGTATRDSDVDLLVVEKEAFGPRRSRYEELRRIRRAIRKFRVPTDVLVFSRDEVEKWKEAVNHVVYDAITEGIVLYDRA